MAWAKVHNSTFVEVMRKSVTHYMEYPFEHFPIWHHPYQSLKSSCDFTNQLLFKEMMKVFEPVTLTGLDSLPNGNYKSPTMRWIAKRYTFRTRRTVINVDYSADAFEG